MAGMVFPSSDEVADMFGFVTNEDRARWATGREKRKLQQAQQGGPDSKAPGMGSKAINPALDMARQSVSAQLRGAHASASQHERGRRGEETETVTTTRKIQRKDAYDLREEAAAAQVQGDDYEPGY